MGSPCTWLPVTRSHPAAPSMTPLPGHHQRSPSPSWEAQHHTPATKTAPRPPRAPPQAASWERTLLPALATGTEYVMHTCQYVPHLAVNIAFTNPAPQADSA